VKVKKLLRAVQREVLIAHTSAYRTASWESLCVVGGQTPIDLLLYERRALYEVRKGRDVEVNGTVIGKDIENIRKIIRKEITKMWQTRWEVLTKGRVTFTFFNNKKGFKPNGFSPITGLRRF